MRWVRLWLPLAIIAGGVIIIIATGGSTVGWEGGGAVIGAGLSVWLLNFFFRVGVKGDRERDAEDLARRYFDEHGRWPDEEPVTPEPPAPEPPARHPHRTGRPAGHPSGRRTGSSRRHQRRP